jgi:tetratricopeptide (TPR) repeat protein
MLFCFNRLKLAAIPTLVMLAVTASTAAAQAPCLDATCLADKAEADAQYVRGDDIDRFATDLARAGRFAAARTALRRLPTPKPGDTTLAAFRRNSAANALVLSEMAAATWARPYEVASYEAFDTLATVSGATPDDWEIASRYWLLAEKIIERFEPSLISLDLEKILRKRIVRHGHNATLDDLLQSRWPQAIEKLPEREQGELWNYVTKIYTEMGNAAAAEEMLDRAEQRGGYESQGLNRIYVSTTHSWLRLGNIDRALNAARRTPKDSQVQMKLFVARALLNAGRQETASKVFEELETDFENDPEKSIKLGFLIGIEQGFLDLGDLQAARKVTERVLEIARLPSVVPGGQLAYAARAYNNIGDHARAVALLQEAASKAPPSKAVAYGISGPISGVGDSIRSEIAKELYRAGDIKSFDEQFALLSPWYQNELQRWRARSTLDSSHPQRSPALDQYFGSLPPDGRLSAAIDLAVSAIADDENELAGKLLRTALDKLIDGNDARSYAYVAKVAFAGGLSELVVEALQKAASAAFAIDDRGTRATTLATVAAFQHELLDGPRQ